MLIDYQNCYMAAREAFHDRQDPGYLGNLRPKDLGNLLTSKGAGPADLVFVGVYAGVADRRVDPRTEAARQRQALGWRQSGATVYLRPLWYPPKWARKRGERPREKGIDVKLAIDAMMLGAEDRADTIIIASCDSDLDPVVEGLLEMRRTLGRPHEVEAIAWRGRSNKLSEVEGLAFRWIGERDYRAVRDETDYNLPSPR